jgi:hypothetical protein
VRAEQDIGADNQSEREGQRAEYGAEDFIDLKRVHSGLRRALKNAKKQARDSGPDAAPEPRGT